LAEGVAVVELLAAAAAVELEELELELELAELVLEDAELLPQALRAIATSSAGRSAGRRRLIATEP
jgi:hypothetical protein